MHPQERPRRSSGPSLLAPSRRSLVRAAAWSVPVVSVAAAAPAYAVLSSHGPLIVQQAEYYVHAWGDGTYGIVPQITLYNPRAATATPVFVTLTFPTADFTGLDDSTDPPLPDFRHFAVGDQGWSCGYDVVEAGATAIYVDLIPVAGIGGSAVSTVGSIAPSSQPVSLDWKALSWLTTGEAAPRILLQVAAQFADDSKVAHTPNTFLTPTPAP